MGSPSVPVREGPVARANVVRLTRRRAGLSSVGIVPTIATLVWGISRRCCARTDTESGHRRQARTPRSRRGAGRGPRRLFARHGRAAAGHRSHAMTTRSTWRASTRRAFARHGPRRSWSSAACTPRRGPVTRCETIRHSPSRSPAKANARLSAIVAAWARRIGPTGRASPGSRGAVGSEVVVNPPAPRLSPADLDCCVSRLGFVSSRTDLSRHVRARLPVPLHLLREANTKGAACSLGRARCRRVSLARRTMARARTSRCTTRRRGERATGLNSAGGARGARRETADSLWAQTP